MSSATRRCSSTPATPTTIDASTAGWRLVPDDDQLPGLKADYDAMRAAAIVADDAPGFDTLIEEIRTLEADANRPG